MKLEQLILQAQKQNLPASLVIKDFYQRKYLENLVSSNLTLQGGGALNHFYGSPRLSRDLDFIYQNQEALNEASEAAKRISPEVIIKNKPNIGLTRIKAYFPFEHATQKTLLIIELYKALAIEKESQTLGKNIIQVSSPKEIASDKVISLLARAKKWEKIKEVDLYDLFYLKKHLSAEPDRKIVHNKLKDYHETIEIGALPKLLRIIHEGSFNLLPILQNYLPMEKYRELNKRDLQQYIKFVPEVIKKCI